jgi:hypothetical protein
MMDSKVARSSDAHPDPDSYCVDRIPLLTRIHCLKLLEQGARLRRDWPGARAAAEERASLQVVRQYAEAKRLA